MVHNRDVNPAKNILTHGLARLADETLAEATVGPESLVLQAGE